MRPVQNLRRLGPNVFHNKLSLESHLMQRLKQLSARFRNVLLLSTKLYHSTVGQLICFNTISHMVTFEADNCCVLKAFLETGEKSHRSLDSNRIILNDFISSVTDTIFLHFNYDAKNFFYIFEKNSLGLDDCLLATFTSIILDEFSVSP